MKRGTATSLKILGGLLLMVGLANLFGYLLGKADREGRRSVGESCEHEHDCEHELSCQGVGLGRERICAQECSSDMECPEPMLCEEESHLSDHKFCSTVTRGPVATGEPCQVTDQCQSGRCVFGRIEHSGLDPNVRGAFNFGRDGVCSHQCAEDSDCPDGMTCIDTTTVALTNSPVSDAFHREDKRSMCFPLAL